MSGAEGPKDGTPEDSARKESHRTTFAKGDLVVYPNHGAGRIVEIEKKTILGEVRRYYVVYLPDTELTVSIPADGEVDLRVCADEESVAEALALLENGATVMPSTWNHRLKYNQEKIKSGDILEVAEVVRNLSAYAAENGLSTGERSMLMKARQILASEVAFVRRLEIAEAQKLVDGALQSDTGGAVK